MVSRTRPTWDETWFGMAKELVKRGTCLRRNYSALIVTPDNNLISSGYTGAPRGTPNCIDIGECYRNKMNIPSGRNYEKCRSVHAEQNAVINASRKGSTSIAGCNMYVYGEDAQTGMMVKSAPCLMCKRVIINAGIKKVFTLNS